MASFVPSQPGLLTSARSYTSEAWEQKRMIISQLYRDEARSLKDVLAILAQEHDFRPTPAMLKKRIAKWSLDRKRKQSDMLVALRLASQREAQGKETIFWIRGRLVTFQDKQYFRRKGTRDLQSLMATANTTTLSTHIDCHTPEPDLVAVDKDIPFLKVSTDPTYSMDMATHETLLYSQAGNGMDSPGRMLQELGFEHPAAKYSHSEKFISFAVPFSLDFSHRRHNYT